MLRSLAVKSRDNARTPGQWDASENAGFTTGTPWLTVNPNHTEINAEAALADPGSVLHHYKRLFELRHTEPVVVHGDVRMLLPADEQVFAYTRTLEGTTLLVAANLSGQEVTVDLGAEAAVLAGDVLVSTHARASAVDPASPAGSLTLAPWESLAVVAR